MEPPSAAEIAVLKRQILKKGAEINDKLTALLNGQEVDVTALVSGGPPGPTPIERLRHFMALIDKALAAIRDGTYGRCEQCHDGIPLAHLQQVPWIDTCQACAAKAAATAP